ncbi:MAG: YtxH domain-containing protein [Candidatus Omnitrophota bacterium]
MEYNQNSMLKNVGFFLAGGLIGAGLALLFAPVSGKEAREVIGNKYDDLKDDVKDAFKKMEKKVTKLGSKVKM